jgi:hypothetical protein
VDALILTDRVINRPQLSSKYDSVIITSIMLINERWPFPNEAAHRVPNTRETWSKSAPQLSYKSSTGMEVSMNPRASASYIDLRIDADIQDLCVLNFSR